MMPPSHKLSFTRRAQRSITGAYLAAALSVVVVAAAGGATLYDATNAGGVTQGTVHYLQKVTMGGTNEYYTITGFSAFGLHTTDTQELQRVQLVINFYTGVDLNPDAANPLANAVLIGQQIYNASAPVADALIGINFDHPFVAPRAFAIEIVFLKQDGSDYSDIMTGRFTLAAPVFGNSSGFVWSDANRDGAFTNDERTTFGAAQGNIRVKVVGVPTPLPRITQFQVANGMPRISFTSAGGYVYSLQSSSVPASGNWETVAGATNMPGNGNVMVATDTRISSGTAPMLFYRVVVKWGG